MSVRFAPSPTGRLHIGNLRTAWISQSLARALQLDWVVRIEDIDTPRVLPGAAEQQLSDLRELNLVPDRLVLQSESHARHEELFRMAVSSGKVYPCFCSRKEVQATLQGMASAPHFELPIYSGRCRDPDSRHSEHPLTTLGWRFLNPEDPAGRRDFIVARTAADGSAFAPSYHWACAIDDHDGAHRLLVRASDLSHVVPQQRLIFDWLSQLESSRRKYPAVFHAALVVTDDGQRLEKRTRGITLQELNAAGVSAIELTHRFSESFDSGLASRFSPGLIWGEDPPQIPLSRLGL